MIEAEALMSVLLDYQRGHAADESDMARILQMPVAHYLGLLLGKRQASEVEKTSICVRLRLNPETIFTTIPIQHVLPKQLEFGFVNRMWIKSTLIHVTRIEYAEYHNKGLTTARMRIEATHDLMPLGMTERDVDDCLFIYPDETISQIRVKGDLCHRLLGIRVNIGNKRIFTNGMPSIDLVVSTLVFRCLYLGYSTVVSDIRYGETQNYDVCLIEVYGILERSE